LYFGAAGIFFLFIIHGIYLNVLSKWLGQCLREPLAGTLSVALFFTNPELFGVGQAFVTQVKLFPVWIVLLYLLSRRRVTGWYRGSPQISAT
jgi:hypothetical protein